MYLVLDLETTGTEVGYHEIIQLGAVLLDQDFNEISNFFSNVCPVYENRFSKEAQKVHYLSMIDLENSPAIYEIIPQFEDWILKSLKLKNKKELRNLVLAGQSVYFDIIFLQYAYKQNQIPYPFSHKILDLKILAFYYFTILKNNNIDVPQSLSLESIANFFNLKRSSNVHNALEDAILTAKCISIILNESKKFKII
ncbi:MAG: 3'-5' exonuclease [bacterium]|nr:3'-5' exonuclease [bacterium]